MTDTFSGPDLVHVHRGRRSHLRASGPEGRYRTACGKVWAAIILGPPASEMPLCDQCTPKAASMGAELPRRHPRTGRFLAYDCEIDCQKHCAGLCGEIPAEFHDAEGQA